MYGDDDGNTVIGRRLGGGICDRCFDHPRAELVKTEADLAQEAEKKAWAVVKATLKAMPDTSATTTPFFWDCECDVNYIHDTDTGQCYKCHVRLLDDPAPPDSRLREVLLMLIEEAGL